jgi:hypothetical protein
MEMAALHQNGIFYQGESRVLQITSPPFAALVALLFLVAGPNIATGQIPGACDLDVEIAVVDFSDGITGRITYDSFTNTSRSIFSDGSFSNTTHLGATAFTIYSDGRTSSSTYNSISRTITTTFNDNSMATTSFNRFTSSVFTQYSDGRTATITYSVFPVYVESDVCGIHLMPKKSNIVVNPEHPAVQEIKKLRQMDVEELESRGWTRSGG